MRYNVAALLLSSAINANLILYVTLHILKKYSFSKENS